MVESQMSQEGINENDLDAESKNALNRLKNNTNRNSAEIDTDKKLLNDKVSTQKQLKILDDLLEKYEKETDEKAKEKNSQKN